MSLMDGEDLSVLPAMEALAVAQIAPFLGTVGGTIAVLGVMYCSITLETPFRAARMIIADYLKIDF
jgi:carbon starvation protein CstA